MYARTRLGSRNVGLRSIVSDFSLGDVYGEHASMTGYDTKALDTCAHRVYSYVYNRDLSRQCIHRNNYEVCDCICLPVPGILGQRSKAEEGFTQAAVVKWRMHRRSLSDIHREKGPTSVAFCDTLEQLLKEAGYLEDSVARRRVILATASVWRLCGNTERFFCAVGLIKDWGCDTKAFVTRSVNEFFSRNDYGVFGSRASPARDLRSAVMGRNQHEFDKHVWQVLMELDVFFGAPLATAAELSFALCQQGSHMPFWELCRIFRGIPWWGGGPGPSGYSHNGAYGAHPQREPRYHTKELCLDVLAVGARVCSGFGPLVDCNRRQVPFGGGSVRGALMFLGESPEEATRISAGLTSIVVMNLFNEVFDRRSKFDRQFNAVALVRDLNDLQFNFCEGSQFWTVSASHLRSFLSEQQRLASNSVDVLPVMPEVMPEVAPRVAPAPSAEEIHAIKYIFGSAADFPEKTQEQRFINC